MKTQKEFSLIELVIVLIVIGLLIAASSGCCKKKKKNLEPKEKCVEGVVYQKQDSGIWLKTELVCLEGE